MIFQNRISKKKEGAIKSFTNDFVRRKMSRIVCLTGLSGSGKSEIVCALEKDPRIGVVRLGETVRKKCQLEKFIGTTEEYAEKFRFSSICVFLEKEIKIMLDCKEIVVVDSVRTMADYQFLLKMSKDVKLIMIIANRKKRLEWIRKRNRIGDPFNELKLLNHDYWELNYGISSLFGLVDKLYINDGNISSLQDTVMEYITCK